MDDLAFVIKASPPLGSSLTFEKRGDFSVSFSDFVPDVPRLDAATFAISNFTIIRDKKICGGAPTIRGTRISVHHLIAQMTALGWNKERVAQSYPHLTPEQIQVAIAYFQANKPEIERLIEQEEGDEIRLMA